MEGETFKLRTVICLWGLSLPWVLLRTRSAHRLSSQHLASVAKPNIAELVPSVSFSVHNHGFCDGPSAFSQEKHPCLSQLSNSRNIESSRSACCLNSQHSAAVPISNIAELVLLLLSTTMVFVAVRTHFSRKTSACLVDPFWVKKYQNSDKNQQND